MSITKAYLDVALFFGKEEYLAAFNNFTFNFLMFLLQRFLVHFHLKKKTLSTSICKNGTDDWRPPVRSLPSFPLRPPSPQFFPYLVLPLKKKEAAAARVKQVVPLSSLSPVSLPFSLSLEPGRVNGGRTVLPVLSLSLTASEGQRVTAARGRLDGERRRLGSGEETGEESVRCAVKAFSCLALSAPILLSD